MSQLDFINNHRQLTENYQNQFEITCSIVEFEDKIIINLMKDGETDTSYDLQLPSLNESKLPIMYEEYNDRADEGADAGYYREDISSNIMPTVLIGENTNMKNQVMASQIGKLINQLSSKNIILNTSGKFFGYKSQDEVDDDDFNKLGFIMQLVKRVF